MRRCSFLIVCLVLATALPACSGSRVRAVPEALEDRAEIPGLEGIRSWGHQLTPSLAQALRESWDREIAFNGGDRGAVLASDAHYLALSGGGADGAFGAGLLCGWSQRGDRPAFKVVTGISTGALIAPFVFAGPEYDHVLRELYTSVRTRDIATSRGVLGALVSDALADTHPLRHILEAHIDDAFLDHIAAEYGKGRLLIIGTTNMDAQKPVIWRMGALAASDHPRKRELFIDVLIASAAIPGAFPPVMIDVEADGEKYSEMHADGGTAAQVFLYPASFSFTRFADSVGMGARVRHAYVIRNSRLAADWEEVAPRAVDIAERAIATLIKSQGIGDLYRIYLGCQRDGIEFNLAAIPDSFTERRRDVFDPVYMRKVFDVGLEVGKSPNPWVHAPPGFETPVVGESPR